MAAQILDGKAVAAQMKDEMRAQVGQLAFAPVSQARDKMPLLAHHFHWHSIMIRNNAQQLVWEELHHTNQAIR